MKLRSTGFTLLVALAAALAVAPLAHADVTDFTIDNFAADYTLGRDDPQGTLTVREQLTVNFTSQNHGILRALPQRYNSMPQPVQVSTVTRDGMAEPYTTYTSNNNLVLKIGSPSKVVTGLHHYEIDYKVTNVIRFVGNRAELNWNVNGTEWQQSFLHVSAQLHVPTSLQDKLSDARCFTGRNASTESACLVSESDGVSSYTTTRVLTAGETLTFNSTVAAGIFTKPVLADRWSDYMSKIVPIVGIPLLALILVGSVWYKYGRDAKGKGTIIPEYAPPDGLRPAEIDVILHNKLGKNAISATIIDLAIRKYLSIQEGQSDGVLGFGKHKTYSFVRLATPAVGKLQGYEAQVYAGIFGGDTTPEFTAGLNGFSAMATKSNTLIPKFLTSKLTSVSPAGRIQVGQSVEMSTLKSTFFTTAKAVKKAVPKSLATSGYFRSNPDSLASLWQVFGFGILFFSGLVLHYSWASFVGLLLAGLVIIVFGLLMPSRTPKGAAAKDTAEGLKLYLNIAEKDRIAMLQSPSAPYAAQSTEPVKTVHLFEKLLPYAMVLGVEKQWAKQFEGIYATPPDWYSGNWTTFSTLYLADSLSSSMSAMNSSFAAPSSGNSGFSGGAGGGGGGGGGGGW